MEKPRMTAVTAPAGQKLAAALTVLWLITLSATIAETDAYRYTALALTGIALFRFRDDLDYLRRDWLAWACIAWSIYALVRFIYGMAVHGEKGSSEWLYVFPLFFPALGVALHAARRQVPLVAALFFSVACITLLIFTSYTDILAGERVTPLFHKNSIHGAVGCGLILIGAFYWIMHAWEDNRVCDARGYAALAIGLVTIALCLFNIFGSKSKGVWLALAVAAALMAVSLLFYARIRHIWPAITACILLLAASLFLARDNIDTFAGPTARSVVEFAEMASAPGGITGALHQAIGMEDTPGSLRERLQLWVNALEVISANPVFGAGNHWLSMWEKTTYSDLPYTIMHNGYIELVIRHGLAGLLVVTIMALAACQRMISAWRKGAISTSVLACFMVVLVYFSVTLFSNSNNRLAIGESWLSVMGAIVFAIVISTRVGNERGAGTESR